MRFAEATRLESPDGTRFDAYLQPGWDAFGVANGGYLLALAARAAVTAAGRTDPLTVTAHYVGPGRTGTDVRLDTRMVRDGRNLATVAVDMTADGSPILAAVVTCGTVSDVDIMHGPPDLPPPEACELVVPGDPLPPPMTAHVETRLHPDDDFRTRGPTGHARMRGWFRLLDGEPISSLAAVLATDTWPPPLFAAHGPSGWIATIELTVQVRSRPRGEWLACSFGNTIVSDRTVSWDGLITDEAGRLVATCRQLALLPRT